MGLKTSEEVLAHPVLAYMSIQWDDVDLRLMQVQGADLAGQARVEALALSISINTWTNILTQAQGRLAVRGDALGVLFDVMR